MITVIAGSRSANNMLHLLEAIEHSGFTISKVICGTANGGDTLGEEWGIANNVPVDYYPADWDLYGKSAGYIRNAEMGKVAEQAIILWDGQSRGTKNMINIATKKGIPIFVYIFNPDENIIKTTKHNRGNEITAPKFLE